MGSMWNGHGKINEKPFRFFAKGRSCASISCALAALGWGLLLMLLLAAKLQQMREEFCIFKAQEKLIQARQHNYTGDGQELVADLPYPCGGDGAVGSNHETDLVPSVRSLVFGFVTGTGLRGPSKYRQEISLNVEPSFKVEATRERRRLLEASNSEQSKLPLIILITPTFPRPAQAQHIVNVVNLLRTLPPPILWIVVESNSTTVETKLLLERTAGRCINVGAALECTGLTYLHMTDGLEHEDPRISRGANMRNAALHHIEEQRIEGIVYFMDDDNAYTPQLFEEIRKVQRVGIWPVGFLWSREYQQLNHRGHPDKDPWVERPLVRRNQGGAAHVVGWETFRWTRLPNKRRKYYTDMAGFAFSSKLMWEPPNETTGKPNHPISFRKKIGSLESLFLELLIAGEEELEPLGSDCQEVLVWHTKMETRWAKYPRHWHLPQPGDSQLVPGESRSARYLINQRDYKIDGYEETTPYGYW